MILFDLSTNAVRAGLETMARAGRGGEAAAHETNVQLQDFVGSSQGVVQLVGGGTETLWVADYGRP